MPIEVQNMKSKLTALVLVTISLTGCTTALKSPENPTIPQSLYIIVERNQRLPAEFMTALQAETEKRLPGADIKITEGGVEDQAIAGAEWIMALRATRIVSNYSFKPADNSTVNGITDCLAGSSFGPGVIMAPCLYRTDQDVLEASIRDNSSKTLKTYTAQQHNEGWFWVLPISAIQSWFTGQDQQQNWRDLLDTLYDKMLADGVFKI
jgi:hypothetical protein